MRNRFPTSASCFGKLPAALDFVRVRHDSTQAIQLDRWLERAVQRLAARGQRWPDEPLRFVFSVADAGAALVGVAAPSRDRAGRRFPLAVFARVPCEGSHAALPLASARFLDAAEALLAESAAYDVAQLSAAVSRLPLVEPSQLRTARFELHEQLSERPFAEFALTLFGEAAPLATSSLQRLRDFLAGAARERVFECPVAAPRDCAAWLRLAELASSGPHSCLWHIGLEAGRMLIGNGPLPEAAALHWSTASSQAATVRATAVQPLPSPAAEASLAAVFASLITPQR